MMAMEPARKESVHVHVHRYTYMVMHVGVTTTVRFEIGLVLSPTCIYRQHTELSTCFQGQDQANTTLGILYNYVNKVIGAQTQLN